MKRILGVIIAVLVLVVGALVGYKFVYKLSPRDFITDDTKFVYALENISSKDIDKYEALVADDEVREVYEKYAKDFRKYISSIYMVMDKEITDMDMMQKLPGVFIADPGYAYIFAGSELEKKYEKLDNGIYVVKLTSGETVKNFYIKPYRGLLIISTDVEAIDPFIATHKDHAYRKNIENALDENRDSLMGVAVYESPLTDDFGIKYVVYTGNIEDDMVTTDYTLYLNDKTKEMVKNTHDKRDLAKYVKKDDLYIAVDDASKLEPLIFNPYVIGANVDREGIISFWKTVFGIDIRAMLKEIDGEAVFTLTDGPDFGGMIKLKKDSTIIRNMIGAIEQIIGAGEIAEIKNDTLLFGNMNPQEAEHKYNIPKGTFMFLEADIPYQEVDKDGKVNVLGQDGVIKVDIVLPEEIVRKVIKEMQ